MNELLADILCSPTLDDLAERRGWKNSKEFKAFERWFGPLEILEDNMSETLYKNETIKTFGHKQTREDSWRWWLSCVSGNVYSFFAGTDQKAEVKYLADLEEGDSVKLAYTERSVDDKLYYDLKGVSDVVREVEKAPSPETGEEQADATPTPATPNGGFSTDTRIKASNHALDVLRTFDLEGTDNEGRLTILLALTKTYEMYFRGAALSDQVFGAEKKESEDDMEVPFNTDDKELANVKE